MYVNYCHQCGRALSSGRTDRCDRCGWLQCSCGACGCDYERAGLHPALATVPPVWAMGAQRHVAIRQPEAARLRVPMRTVGAALFALVLALGLLASATLLAPGVAVAPDGTASNREPASVQAGPLPAARPEAVAPPALESPAAVESTPPAGETLPASPLPSVLYVANTDGQGAYLRTQPRDGTDTRIVAWREGTAVTPLERRVVDNAVWFRVRDPNGQTGWVREVYLTDRR